MEAKLQVGHTRQHRKSRLGCKLCKARKVKCDEVRPVCGNCYRRFVRPEVECSYSTEPEPSSHRPSPVPSPRSSMESFPSTPIPREHAMEREIFFHYATTTLHHMPFAYEPTGKNYWSAIVPTFAFESTYTYHALLAMSAIHLSTLSPNIPAYKTAAHHYLALTFAAHRTHLAALNEDNCQRVIVVAIVLAFTAKIRSYCTDLSEYALPVTYFYLAQGIGPIWLRFKAEVDESDVGRMWHAHPEFIRAARSFHEGKPGYSPHATSFAYLDPKHAALLHSTALFLDFADPALDVSAENRKIYEDTVQYLVHLRDAISEQQNTHYLHRFIASAPTFMPAGFVRLLEEKDKIAMGLLARFFALVRYVEGTWWDVEFEIEGLGRLLGNDWEWILEWPREVLSAFVEPVAVEMDRDE